jgi:hypothetical protein
MNAKYERVGGGDGKEGNKVQPFCAGWLLVTSTLNWAQPFSQSFCFKYG